MLKIFRQIRKKFIADGKTSEYLKYAIGEIALVVFGILIALSLNNWNEKKNQEADFDKLINALESEIIENIEETNFEINNYRQAQSIASKILLSKISRKQFLDDRYFRSLIEVNRLDINSEDISSLVKRQDNFPVKFKVLIPHLKNYLKIEKRYYLNELEYGEHVTDYHKYVIETQPWYAASYATILDSTALSKQVDFYIENQVYKNYLTSYIDGYRYSLREMIGIRSVSLVILAEIKRIREGFDVDDIKNLFSTYNLRPYIELNCDEYISTDKSFNEPSTYLPLLNASNQTLEIQWEDYDLKAVSKIQLEPGELKINPASKRMQENILIMVSKNGECKNKYQARTNGYLVIE